MAALCRDAATPTPSSPLSHQPIPASLPPEVRFFSRSRSSRAANLHKVEKGVMVGVGASAMVEQGNTVQGPAARQRAGKCVGRATGA
jgi:hypothetical protein